MVRAINRDHTNHIKDVKGNLLFGWEWMFQTMKVSFL